MPKTDFLVNLVPSIGLFRRPFTRGDPGFIERGFVCIKVWWVRFAADFISIFLNIP